MTELTLNNWEFEADATNDRIIIRSLDTNEEYYLNEDGSTNIDALTIKGNDIDSNGDGTVDSADNADQVDGYDIAKDGVDGTGTINFKTS